MGKNHHRNRNNFFHSLSPPPSPHELKKTFPCPPLSFRGGSELDLSHQRQQLRSKLRASVKCINLVHLFQERIALRRKFRAAIYVVSLINDWQQRIYVRRTFKAAVKIITLSDWLVDRRLGKKFDLETFQNAVNLIASVKRLHKYPESPVYSEFYGYKHRFGVHDEETLKSGLNKLADAVERVRVSGLPTEKKQEPSLALQSGIHKLADAVESVRVRGLPTAKKQEPSRALQSGIHKLADAVERVRVSGLPIDTNQEPIWALQSGRRKFASAVEAVRHGKVSPLRSKKRSSAPETQKKNAEEKEDKQLCMLMKDAVHHWEEIHDGSPTFRT